MFSCVAESCPCVSFLLDVLQCIKTCLQCWNKEEEKSALFQFILFLCISSPFSSLIWLLSLHRTTAVKVPFFHSCGRNTLQLSFQEDKKKRHQLTQPQGKRKAQVELFPLHTLYQGFLFRQCVPLHFFPVEVGRTVFSLRLYRSDFECRPGQSSEQGFSSLRPTTENLILCKPLFLFELTKSEFPLLLC